MARAHLGSTSSLKETPRDQITGAAISIDESVGPTDRLSLPLDHQQIAQARVIKGIFCD